MAMNIDPESRQDVVPADEMFWEFAAPSGEDAAHLMLDDAGFQAGPAVSVAAQPFRFGPFGFRRHFGFGRPFFGFPPFYAYPYVVPYPYPVPYPDYSDYPYYPFFPY